MNNVQQDEYPVFLDPPEGEPTGICEVCGQRFQQYLNPRTNIYSQYGKCPKHKKTQAKPEGVTAYDPMKIPINYIPVPAQRIIHASKARYKIINAGNRFGKDRCTIMECIEYFVACLNEDWRYIKEEKDPTTGKIIRKPNNEMVPRVHWWLIAPIKGTGNQTWRELKQFFPKDIVLDISESDRTILTLYGGVIEMKSAYSSQDLVSVGLDLLTITEAARIPDLEEVWNNLEARVNSPNRGLGGKGGKVMINSSPLGQNYFYKMWTWGQADHPDSDPDFESWTFSAFDNPITEAKYSEVTVDKRGIALTKKERMRRRIGDRAFNQNWLALFECDGQKCFPKFRERCVVRVPEFDEKDGHLLTEQERFDFIREWEEPEPYEQYIIAYDPATGRGDIPAILVFTDYGKVKKAYSMSGYDWPEQYNKIQAISKHYNYAPVAFSDTGHTTIESALTEKGLSCLTFHEQGSNKANFVIHLEGVVSSGEMQVLDDGSEINTAVINQYCDYSRVVHGKTVEFTNVNEPNDDYVSCGYIAFQAITAPDEVLPSVGFLVGMRI